MLHIVADPEEAAVAAGRLVGTVIAGLGRRTDGRLRVGLSGGTTPRGLYRRLAGPPGDRLPWPRVELVWVDERCVPAHDPRSNYGMVRETGLLARPLAAVRRMPGELRPEEGAARYQQELADTFGDGPPRLDLAVLGLGEDGHLASLFPGSPTLAEWRRWVVETEEYQGTRRLTLTLPVLAQARHLLFLVTGKAKAPAVRASIAPTDGQSTPADGEPAPADGQPTPARLLLEAIGWEAGPGSRPPGACPSVTWVLDRAAASLLPAGRALLDDEEKRA